MIGRSERPNGSSNRRYPSIPVTRLLIINTVGFLQKKAVQTRPSGDEPSQLYPHSAINIQLKAGLLIMLRRLDEAEAALDRCESSDNMSPYRTFDIMLGSLGCTMQNSTSRESLRKSRE